MVTAEVPAWVRRRMHRDADPGKRTVGSGLTQQPPSPPYLALGSQTGRGRCQLAQPDHRQDTAERPLVSLAIMSLPTEIDVTCSESVGKRLLAALRSGVRVVIADMSATTYCNSSGIGRLILANNYAANKGAELRIVLSSDAVREVLHVCGADQMLHLYPDMAAALLGAPEVRAEAS